MTLNPITALSEQLQKLINEHGSASILRDHLAMFKDQVLLLEKKTTLSGSENAVLKRKLEESESKINKLTKDNEELRNKIQIHDQTTQQFERKVANNGVVYLRHKTEPNVFACANCSSHDRLLYLLPDPSPSLGDVLVYFCDKCRKSITINKTLYRDRDAHR